jgi:hypothetical protein
VGSGSRVLKGMEVQFKGKGMSRMLKNTPGSMQRVPTVGLK